MQKRIFAAVIAAGMLLTGCSDDETEDDGYKVFSDGTYIVQDEEKPQIPENSEYDFADFYIPEGMITDYYSSNELSDNEMKLYMETREIMGHLKDKTELTVDGEIYSRILNIIRFENLAFPHVSKWHTEYNNGAFEVCFTYRMTADEISSMNMAAEKAAKEIVAQLTPDMDDYEKLKFLHDYLVQNCETDTNYKFADTVYGALVEKKALCEGYAKAYSYLCNLAGIENAIVTGETYVAHMWNMVKVGGNWYHVDITWDNPDDQLHEAFPDVILYQYFMVTDAVIRNSHTISTKICTPPQAFGTAENYFSREGADISSKDELLTAAENAIVGAVQEGRRSAMIKFDTTDLYLSCMNDLDNEHLFDNVIEKVNLEYGQRIMLSWTNFYGQYRIITFVIEYL